MFICLVLFNAYIDISIEYIRLYIQNIILMKMNNFNF